MTLLAAALLAAALGADDAAGRERTPPLVIWRLDRGRLAGPPDSEPLPAGSLLKPFVAEAWARAHPGLATPRFRCDADSGCWVRAGHGALGLSRAIGLSCNAYFRALAAVTPPAILAAVLQEHGFLVPEPLTADAAIGLRHEGAVAARPGALLRAYVRLTREPWAAGESVRRELLAGLRDNATRGTARGLGRYGLWAKTGTVPALDGRPLRTSGLTLAVDDAGSAVLGLLPDGTGRAAARALSAWLVGGEIGSGVASKDPPRGARPGAGAGRTPERVRVALFSTLRPRALRARNLGDRPLATSHGYVGVGASAVLRPGDRLAEGRWLLSVPDSRFRREVVAEIACAEDDGDRLRLRATMAAPEYVAGVLNAELPGAGGRLRADLAAAVLRFLSEGPRHLAADVCDSTHCAWFIGRGPTLAWPAPDTPVLFAGLDSGGPPARPLGAGEWDDVVRRARGEGPRQWTSHCGGRPLSAHAVWGNRDRRVYPCDRHREGSAPWTRTWDEASVEAAFGPGVKTLAVTEVDGVWKLRVAAAAGGFAIGYDEAHRRLAPRLGWAALPSPADSVVREGRGWRADGVGLGHRVGLCLGDERR